MTSGALISKRDEFWETAPSYEGKKEVWEVLRSAAEALERGDVEQAQLMIGTVFNSRYFHPVLLKYR